VIAFKDIVQPSTIEEAYQILTAKQNNKVVGGCAFLRLSSARINIAIDLSKLALDYIKEENGYVEIGAMATFRTMETSPVLLANFAGVLPQAVGEVIGVQFRNIVTVGATVFSRYGFSDLLTALAALDTEVELYKAGRLSLQDFMKRPREKDILTRVFIKLENRIAAYQSLRNSASDFPILNAAVSRLGDQWTVAVGARPRQAAIARSASRLLAAGEIECAAAAAAEELSFADNVLGTAAYRRAMCRVLVKRAITEVLK
jgi:CO/xanthine dehydrogenase FAD-binding subunit